MFSSALLLEVRCKCKTTGAQSSRNEDPLYGMAYRLKLEVQWTYTVSNHW